MKARPIIKRQITFPIVAKWLGPPNNPIVPCIVLFTSNREGIGIIETKTEYIHKFTTWCSLDYKNYKSGSLWKKLGSPEDFGISLTPDGRDWTGNFTLNSGL